MYREVVLENVERGAALLDLRCPGWEDGIELDTLDVGLSGECVLGQLYGDYGAGLTAIGLAGTTDERRAHGFTVRLGSFDTAPELTDAWRRLIEERRAEA